MNEKLVIDKDRIADFFRRHHITRLAIFGSALRDDFGPESDIDVLVDFEPGRLLRFFRLFDVEEELSALFNGRKVDLRTPEDLSRYFRDRVQAEGLHSCGRICGATYLVPMRSEYGVRGAHFGNSPDADSC